MYTVAGRVVEEPGDWILKEVDIAAEITYRQRRAGAERDAFEPIVASGPRGALPHAHPTTRKIRSGDLLTLDFGCTVDGYSSDITRTVGIGAVRAPLRRLYAAVLEAQVAAVAAARPGITGRELDAVARGVLEGRGYGRYFRHGLGHGLGLVLHERPRLSPLSREVLRPGMVLTIEPGAYIPDAGGVRIEDDILLDDEGCTVLTTLPKELVLL
jgi:Xaa-Pro aminopeptidase